MVNKEVIFSFQEKYTLEERRLKFKEIECYLKDCVPIIIEETRDPSQNTSPQINTFLVSASTTFGHMSEKIRQRRVDNPEKAIFFLLNGKIAVNLTTTLADVYEQYKHEDGFLYVSYSYEHVWG